MAYEDLLLTCPLISIRRNVNIFKKWKLVFFEAKSDLDGSRADENWNFPPFIHPYVTEVFNAPKMDRSFQKPFLPLIGQFIKIRDVQAND